MSPSTIKNTVIAIIFMAIGVSCFVFMVLQTDKQGAELSVQIETLAAQRAQQDSFFRLQKTAEETKSERLQLQSYFLLKQSDSIDFLNNVENIAPQAGVELQTSNLDSVQDDDGSDWIEVDFSFKGSRDRVKNFVQILEELPYVSRLIAVDLNTVSQTEWEAKVTMRVRVLEYDT